MDDLERRTGRDTRLLALVIVIAVAVLFGLARFRYPATAVAPVPQTPLERLAASGSFDDLAAAVRNALTSATPSVLLVELESDPPATPVVRRRVAAIRMRAGAAIVHIPAGFHVVVTPDVVIRSPEADRQLAVLTTTSVDGTNPPTRPAADFDGLTYVAVVEAAGSGPTARPVFVGRVETATEAKWSGPVFVAPGASEIPPGALVFTLDGRFVGLATSSAAGLVLVPHGVLDALVGGPPGEGR
jgi:hypothetical protein